VAVTKTRPLTLLQSLARLGVGRFGENRVQEIASKLEGAGARASRAGFERLVGGEVELIGHLQKNKARVHSVDDPRLATRLDHALADTPPGEERLRVLVQVNTSHEPSKHGVTADDLGKLLEEVAALPRLRLQGLMTMAAGGELAGAADAARRSFSMLRELSERHRRAFADPARVELSMGMSGLIRVGSALFEGVLDVEQPGASPTPPPPSPRNER
jgi:uncharacterized pyridoxal phosphate-containing UPF0001 family protein